MKQSFAVLGLGSFGQSVARTLYSLGHEVLAIDGNEETVQAISNSVTHAIEGDCRDENVLRAVGIRNFDVVVVAIGQDLEASILITTMLKELGAPFVVAKAHSQVHSRILKKVGADKVVFPELDMGVRVANSLSNVNVVDLLSLSDGYSIVEINCPDSWVGKSLVELDIRARYGINILAVRDGDDIDVSPDPNRVFAKEDVVIVIGANDDMSDIK
ncbi:MAG TPA: TrkA family potassium uptake protein [Candidatus Aphodoplasma excrementigallinarum]|uniref:TrkA family potassium uptake protein n=1 Tax=Candidatus Aphodoplasma excrementigallinarum TaxID=2840673 RepID=A0A9D1NHB0_9FIRM|nr:TrkA family potassium uptake protein [Candidatus Aphodoplasma excrementigallinarum]